MIGDRPTLQVNNMASSDLKNRSDDATNEAADRFIRRIKSGFLRKRRLPNAGGQYPFEKAAESIEAFIDSPQMENLVNDNDAEG